MIDKKTLDRYETNAAYYADLYDNQYPQNLYDLIKTYFKKGEPSADIGCGSGRDAHFLRECGYPVTGYDASRAMILEAEKRYPGIPYRYAVLPELNEIPDTSYVNILCSAVLMHLPSDKLEDACDNLLRITVPGGIIIISVRSSREKLSRESDGRLYNRISGGALVRYYEQTGAALLYRDELHDETRDDVRWMTFVFERND
ncbi:MAG: class I SAM-dependent methyltransferase [Spirochaetota bacterium]